MEKHFTSLGLHSTFSLMHFQFWSILLVFSLVTFSTENVRLIQKSKVENVLQQTELEPLKLNIRRIISEENNNTGILPS